MMKCQCNLCAKFFDSDKYEKCPHCGGSVTLQEDVPVSSTQSRCRFSLFFKKKAMNTDPGFPIDANIGDGKKNNNSILQQENAADSTETLETSGEKLKDTGSKAFTTGTIGVWQTQGTTAQGLKAETPMYSSADGFGVNTNENHVNNPIANIQNRKKQEPMREAQEKTQGIFHMSATESSVETVESDEPVVGWIVCVKGVCQGKSYHLYAKRNFIGRDPSNDVVITDTSVSRDKHAIITYEPKKKVFYLQQGDGSSLTYLNDDIVLDHQILTAYDKLELGKGTYIFVPFCCEKFSWEDYFEIS